MIFLSIWAICLYLCWAKVEILESSLCKIDSKHPDCEPNAAPKELEDEFRQMTFIFTESFVPNDAPKWNGETYRKVRGLSGTHATSIFLAEAFASFGHTVYFIADSIEIGKYKGVQYLQPHMVEIVNCDVFITTYQLIDFKLLTRFAFFFKKALIIMNNDPIFVDGYTSILTQYPIERFAFVHVSHFAKYNVLFTAQWVERYEQQVWYNSIDIEEIPLPIDLANKQKRFVFFACLERGGKIAFEAALHFPDFAFHTITYAFHHTSDSIVEYFGGDKRGDNQLVVVSNGGKDSIYAELRQAKYFVYPVVNLDTLYIHYDTFGYVILEALLHGVVVIAPRLGCYEELFGDAIVYVEVQDILPAEHIYQWRHDFPNETQLMDIYKSRFISKLKGLERNITLYTTHAKRGIALREKFSHLRIARMMEEYVDQDLKRLIALQNIRSNFRMYQKVFTEKSEVNIIN